MGVKRVLVTRPEPGAAATARRLSGLGCEAVLLPLTATRAVGIAAVPDARRFDAVAVTSSAALRHAPASLLQAFAHLRLFAVGDRTAAAARQAGFGQVESAGGGASELAARIAGSLPPAARVAYLCGRVRTGALAARLAAAGFEAAVVETYDTVAVERTPAETAAALGGRPFDAVLLHSANAAGLFPRLLGRPETGRLLEAARLLCISARTAAALSPSLRPSAEIAARPDEAALLALLAAAG